MEHAIVFDDDNECGPEWCFGAWVLGILVFFTTGLVYSANGVTAACSRFAATVTDISRDPSLLPTGNSVVTFAYNRTNATLAHCSVDVHNTWLDTHTDDHFPLGSTHDIYDCNDNNHYKQCQTAGSLYYFTVVGTTLLIVAAAMCVCPIAYAAILPGPKEPSTVVTTSQQDPQQSDPIID
jgi:hypothetical protein